MNETPPLNLVDVALDVRSGGAYAIWTYRADERVEVGDAVLVPLGNRTLVGYARSVYRANEADLALEPGQLKAFRSILPGLGLPAPLMGVLEFLATEYLCPFPVALGAAVPPGLRDRVGHEWRVLPGVEATDLTRLQREAYEALVAKGGTQLETGDRPLAAPIRRALNLLEAKGLVEKRWTLVPFAKRGAGKSLYRLTSDTDRIESFLKRESRRKPAQALTLMRMQSTGGTALSSVEIKALGSVTDATLNALVSAGFLETVEEGTERRLSAPEPNPHQAAAIATISEAIRRRDPESYLLYGVTGSGKTEVFLRSAENCLREGRQVLYLVPEIALAAQAIAQLRGRFGDRVAVMHSELTPSERLETWIRVRKGELPVVLGARSALFAPLENLGLIIVDEEHETSYKQETAPRYHAKAMARQLARAHGATLVLGSATPSIETFEEARAGQLHRLDLPTRAASAKLPEVHIDNLAESYRKGQPAILAPLLSQKLEATLARQEQAILFLNRRAYAPFLLCRDCGRQFTCPRCAVSLSFSRANAQLRCHHCDHQEAVPALCPDCAGDRLSPMGVGTEKVEEAVTQQFPQARVARLDRDAARKKGTLEKVLTSFRAGEIDVLVGTQMVAKGLDFPRVTLVGVIVADVSLNLPDFRASERTFQLLTQVAGRAGRGERHGEVVIQTFNPHHVAVQCAQTHDFLSLFSHLREERDLAGYPPYRRLVNVLLTGEKEAAVYDASFRAALLLEGLADVEILGPTDAVIPRLQNRWRRHLLLKMPPNTSAMVIGERLEPLDRAEVQVTIDVDPYSMI